MTVGVLVSIYRDKPRVWSTTLLGSRRWYVEPPSHWRGNSAYGNNRAYDTWDEAVHRALAFDMQQRPYLINASTSPAV